MSTEFIHLNKSWNAEPNAPEVTIEENDNSLSLSFNVNPWAYEGFKENERAKIIFHSCSKWRNGQTNDEGWYSGQCRFSNMAPTWGEFYEIKGDLLLEKCPDDWHIIDAGNGHKHFLFYLRDSTFECEADSYDFVN